MRLFSSASPSNLPLPLPPQNLIEYISRQKIYDSVYWKQECFGLSAERLVDKAVELKEVGGCWPLVLIGMASFLPSGVADICFYGFVACILLPAGRGAP